MPTSLRAINTSTSIGDVVTTARVLDNTFLATNGGVYNQVDYPLLYSVVGLIGKPAGYVWSILQATVNHSTAMATDGNGVWMRGDLRSTDNGVTWSAVATAQVFQSLATDKKGVWVGGKDSRTYLSTDNGLTWTQKNAASGASSSYPSRCVATDGNGVWISTMYLNPYMIVSKDNGVTWSTPTSTPGQGGSVAVVSTGNNTWTSANGFRSTDGGTTWAQYGTVQSSTQTDTATMFVDNLNRIVYAGAYGIRRSANGGLTWTSLNNGTISACIVDISGTIFASSGASILISSDDGVTWQTLNIGFNSIYSLVYTTGRLAANTASGFAISTESFPYDKSTQFALPFIQPVPGLKSYIKAK